MKTIKVDGSIYAVVESDIFFVTDVYFTPRQDARR